MIKAHPFIAHIWGKWYPYSRNEIWRQCVMPTCNEKEVKKVTT